MAREQLPQLAKDGYEMLSDRELDVIVLIARGCADTEIAARLGISEHTVRSHRKSIRRKKDAHTMIEILGRALDEAEPGWASKL